LACPVIFTHRLVGHVGQIGAVDVDAQTGIMHTNADLAESMLQNAVKLAKELPDQTASD